MARQKANPGEKAAAEERRVKAFELRKAGFSFRQIGDQLNVSEATSCRDVHLVLKRLAKQSEGKAAEYRQMESERIDALLTSLWPKARGRRITSPETGQVEDIPPDYMAVGQVINLMNMRARLYGLNLQPDENKTAVTIRVVYGDEHGGISGKS